MRRVLPITVAVLSALAACRSQEPVRIGVIVGTTGAEAAQFAASVVNDSGGINGRPLELRFMEEVPTGARGALLAAESVASDPTVVAVVAHGNSSSSISGSQIYNASRLVQIAPTSTAPGLSETGPYTFRLVPSDIHQARFIADQIAVGGAKPRTAVFYVNDDYGRSLFRELRLRLAERGVPIVYQMPYLENVAIPDLDAAVRGMATASAEQLVWLGRNQLRNVLAVARRRMATIRVLASDGVDNIDTQLNRDGAMTGVRHVCFLDVNGSRPSLAALRTAYAKGGDRPISVETALAYDAVMLLATAARTVGPRREAIYDYVRSLGSSRPAYPGVTGDIAFDEHGDPIQPSYCLAEVTAQGARVIPSAAARP